MGNKENNQSLHCSRQELNVDTLTFSLKPPKGIAFLAKTFIGILSYSIILARLNILLKLFFFFFNLVLPGHQQCRFLKVFPRYELDDQKPINISKFLHKKSEAAFLQK